MIYLLYRLIRCKDDWKKIATLGIYFLASGCLGIAIYLLGYKIFCAYKDIFPVGDRGFSRMGIIEWSRLGKQIKQAYIYFVDYFLTNKLVQNSWHRRELCNGFIISLIIGIILFFLWQNRKNVINVCLALAGTILIPLCFMSITVYAPDASIEQATGILMLPHMSFLYLFVLALSVGKAGEYANVYGRKIVKWMVFAAAIYMCHIMILFTQIFQNALRVNLNKDYALAQRIVMQVEALPEYHPDMPIMISGNTGRGNYPQLDQYDSLFYVTKGTVAPYGYFWDTNGSYSCWVGFLNSYLGADFTVCTTIDEIKQTQEYQNMPIFPQEGSVRMIGDCAVVKLSMQ